MGSDLRVVRMPVCRLRRSDLPVFERYANDSRPGIRQEWRAERLNPLYAHRLTILSFLAPGLVPQEYRATSNMPFPEDLPPTAPNPDGWFPDFRPTALARARNAFAETLGRFHLGGRNCDALRELLACCKRDGVPAAVFVMPEGPVFRSWYAPGAEAQALAWLKDQSAEFGVPFIDTHDWMQSEDDFKDSHHLTLEGRLRGLRSGWGRRSLCPLLKGCNFAAVEIGRGSVGAMSGEIPRRGVVSFFALLDGLPFWCY